MKQKGKLVRWNEDRGFGFIQCPGVKNDIFIHISELKKMSRRPEVGDTIFFDVVTDNKGKSKAVHAKIEGVEEIASYNRTRRTKKPNNALTLFRNILFLIIIFIIGYATFPSWSNFFSNSLSARRVDEDFTGYRCQGKQYCSQMTSCKEARFYLKNCPNVKIDGDRDGVPCESQWCD